MMILRKHRKTAYTTIDNELLTDSRLSFKARGLGAYLLSKPDDWRIVIGHLENESPNGRGVILSAIKELKEYGYYQTVQKRDANGRIIDNRAEIADYPAFLQVNRSVEKPTYGKTTRRKTDTNTNNGFIPIPDTLPKTEEKIDASASLSLSGSGNGKEKSKQPTDHQLMFEAICKACGWDMKIISKKNAARVGTVAGKLERGGYTIDDMREWYKSVWPKNWKAYNKNGDFQTPSPEDILEGILHLKQTPDPVAKRSKVTDSMTAVDNVMGMIRENRHG